MMLLQRIKFLMNRADGAICFRKLFIQADCRLPIGGTQSALASVHKKPSQTHQSAIGNQKSAILHLPGGVS